ncbi:chaperone NapD [Inmirania thermothiophila]|uniref:Chaperone NapD n=1 Tax=Inmirania thermothiophila TaxID=1750597 RepID=A0A3N1XZP3_9GAMM|nr:chaperone NapD [Inmirania thermothiophila]ROR32040.1 periplasmic nitrate reductase chaperone NapD [Inmirania thermothiophila]
MDVAGVVVYVQPGRTEPVLEALRGVEGVEVHGRAGAHRIVVTVEETPRTPVAETLARVSALPGVLVAATVYEYCDSADQAEA